MTTAERRLEQLTQDLTARERAILVMQSWLRGEKFDTNLRDRIPEEQKAEYDRVINAVEKSNADLRWGLVFEQRFLFETEIRLGWLQSLAPALERCRVLEKALKAKGVRVRESPRARTPGRIEAVLVPSMPVVDLGRALPEPLFGVHVGEDFSAQRWSDEALVAGLLRSVGEDLVYRAQTIDAYETVAREMTVAFDGFNAVHKDLEHALSVCKSMLHRLHVEAQKFGSFELLRATAEQVEQRRTWVDLDDIRSDAPVTTAGGQQWESDYAKKQREEANAKWREQLAAEQARLDDEPADSDAFTPGAEG